MANVIQVFKPYFRTEEILGEIRECLERGWTGIGFKTEAIETEWTKYSGFKHAHFLNSATSGLHLAFNIFKQVLGWRDGDEVISTPLTFVSTNHAILYEGLNPVFADVDESLCLSPESVEKAITARTRAVIFVGIGGNAANYREIRELCRKRNLVFILDAAHMAGTRWIEDGVHVGLDADCAIFSFQAVKNCPSADAGMICFSDQNLDAKARKLSWLGIDKSTYSRYSESAYKWRYDVDEVGFKYHGNSIIASLCLVSLRYLEEDNTHRRRIAAMYDERLSGRSDIQLFRHSDSIISSRHAYQIGCERRDALIDRMAVAGIYCGVHYVSNANYRPYHEFKNLGMRAQYYSDRLVSLPLHLGIGEAEVDRIVSEIE